MSGRSEQAARRIACAAIVAAAGVGLGFSVHHDVQFTGAVTNAKYSAKVNDALHQAQCISAAIRLAVPKGATVYTTDPNSTPAYRLAEWSTAWAVPEANIADAQYQLTLVPAHGRPMVPFPLTNAAPDPAKGQCEGLTLEVRRL